MTTLTLNITDNSAMPLLLKAIEKIKGVTIAHTSQPAEQTEADEKTDEKTDGEKWAREVLIPTYLDVLDMERKGIDLPDAYDFFKELEEQEA